MGFSIAVDIGTTTVKAILFGEGPKMVQEASKEYRTYHPKPSWAEQDPDDWWNGTVECIWELLGTSGVDPEEIKVISVSSQSPALLPVDREGRKLGNALIWMDRRSVKEREILAGQLGEQHVFDLTGNRLDTYFTLTELMWYIRHEPERMQKCYKLLQVNGYVNLKLTGVFSVDVSNATLTQFFDVHQERWCEELIRAAGADPAWMPDVYECMDVLGPVSREAAALTGLSEKTVVLAGTVDATAAALEIGVNKGGKVAEVTGTSSLVLIGFDQLVTAYDLCYLRGRKPGSTVLYGPVNTAGGSLKWFRNHLYEPTSTEEDAYIHISEEIQRRTDGPSGLIFLPYLTGERAPIWDPDARGCFIGIHMDTSRVQIMRSVMEGTSFALAHNLETARKAGFEYDDIISCGGCTKSDIWLKIKASIIDRPIHIPEMNLGAQGGLSYMNAAFMGEYSSPEEASESCLRIRKTIEPVPEWVAPYQELYQIYKETYQSLKPQFAALARL